MRCPSVRYGLGTTRPDFPNPGERSSWGLCDRPPEYTIIEMGRELDIAPQWIYRGISKGRIKISNDSTYGCYLFPRTKAAVARMKQVKCGKVQQFIFRNEHGD
jgi:hypothetical protein